MGDPGSLPRLRPQFSLEFLLQRFGLPCVEEGFVEPAVYWIGDELQEFCHAHLLGSGFNRLGLLDAAYVRDLVQRFARDKDFTTGKKVWNLLVYAIWEAQLGAS